MERSETVLLESAADPLPVLADALRMVPADGAAPPEPGAALAVVSAAERALTAGTVPAETWHSYLDRTRRREFLLALPDAAARTRWAETTFDAIRASRYSLAALLSQRVAAHPDRVFLQASPRPEAPCWTYAQTERRLRGIAAALASLSEGPPRVAIVAENSLDSACCDLACLVHGIFVAPLAPHLQVSELTSLLQRLGANLVVVDTADQLAKVEAVAARLPFPVRPVLLDAAARLKRSTAAVLGEEVGKLGAEETDRALRALSPFGLDDAATVLFTSGSTGTQKGFAFSPFNLLTKRFARAAALPFVGEGEVLLCYLPLYHTFGRYLEMLGTLFWGGTYVFAGNPSLETLLAGLRQVRPTGLVSVPARWQQIHEQVPEAGGGRGGRRRRKRRPCGKSPAGASRWGLSAAGYLEPAVFRFFQRMRRRPVQRLRHDRGDRRYHDDAARALRGRHGRRPAARDARASGRGRRAAHRRPVCRPLPRRAGGGSGRASAGSGPATSSGRGRAATSRSSTASRTSTRTAGARRSPRGAWSSSSRVCPASGGRSSPATGATTTSCSSCRTRRPRSSPSARPRTSGSAYFARIVAAANRDLAPYERVVDFAVLDRDFSLERGELTPKGSYRRKAIEKSFQDLLASLYRGTAVQLEGKDLQVRVPRWLHRDLGILEGDLVLGEDALEDRSLKIDPDFDSLDRWLAELTKAGGIERSVITDSSGKVVISSSMLLRRGDWIGPLLVRSAGLRQRLLIRKSAFLSCG